MPKENLFKSTTSAERIAATTEAAEEVVAMDTTRHQLAEDDQRLREQLIAQCHEVIGRIQGLSMVSKFANVSNLVWMRDAKAQKIYREIPNIGTWEKFCNSIGISRQKMDEDLSNLAVFGEDFLTTVSSLSVGYRELRKLRSSVNDGRLLIENNTVEINGNRIPLDPDHSEDLQAEIEVLIDTKDRSIEQRDATLKAKDRVLKEKEKVIQKQEEAIAKHEKTLQERGFAPGEERFLKDIEIFNHTIQGLALKLDPDNLPPNPTTVMTSTYIEALGRAWRVMKGYYDGACEQYGDPLDDDWEPPPLPRDKQPGSGPEEHPCAKCELRKGKANTKKGRLIHDYHGKCTRDGGHCDLYNQFIEAS